MQRSSLYGRGQSCLIWQNYLNKASCIKKTVQTDNLYSCVLKRALLYGIIKIKVCIHTVIIQLNR